MKHEEEFARLLSEGIHLISIRKGLTIAAVENHLGKALGREGKNPGSAIAYWRQRNIPANTTVRWISTPHGPVGRLEPSMAWGVPRDGTGYPIILDGQG